MDKQTKTVHYKVYEHFDGKDTLVSDQSFKFSKDVIIDVVTNQPSVGIGQTQSAWNPPTYIPQSVDVTKPGYQAQVDGYDVSEVGSMKIIQPTDENIEVHVTYVPLSQQMDYIFVDDDMNGQKVQDVQLTGKTGQTVDTNLSIPAGYKLAGDQDKLPVKYTFAAENKSVTIHLIHATKLADKDHVPSGYKKSDFTKDITRTITVTKPGETTPEDHSQTTTITRTGTYDEVTKNVTFDNWTKGNFGEYVAPVIEGYTPSQAKVEADNDVTADYFDPKINITYTAESTDEPDAKEQHVPADVTKNDDLNKSVSGTHTDIKTQSGHENNATTKKLPQTGNDQAMSIAGLGLASAAAMLGLASKKRRN